jgi:hypothetical protein
LIFSKCCLTSSRHSACTRTHTHANANARTHKPHTPSEPWLTSRDLGSPVCVFIHANIYTKCITLVILVHVCVCVIFIGLFHNASKGGSYVPQIRLHYDSVNSTNHVESHIFNSALGHYHSCPDSDTGLILCHVTLIFITILHWQEALWIQIWSTAAMEVFSGGTAWIVVNSSDVA